MENKNKEQGVVNDPSMFIVHSGFRTTEVIFIPQLIIVICIYELTVMENHQYLQQSANSHLCPSSRNLVTILSY
jgi:hypothetical protein